MKSNIPDAKVTSKKAYKTPQLLMYGGLAEMTRHGGSKGQVDNTKGMSMT